MSVTLAVCAFLLGTWSADVCAGAESVSAADSVRYEMIVHPETGIELPRIMLPDRPEVETTVNHALDSLAATMHCETGDLQTNEAMVSFDAWSEVTHATDDMFSIHVRASYFCGGPYPTDGANLSMTFDLKTGLSVPFRDLFARFDSDQDAIIESIIAMLSTARIEQASDAGDDACAAVYDSAQMRHFHYHINAGDLMVEPALPRVLQACGVTATVPIDSLRSFLESDGLLMRLR